MKSTKVSFGRILLLSFIAAGLASYSEAQGQSTWDAGCGTNMSWACGANWQPNGYPSPNSDVLIGTLVPNAATLFVPQSGLDSSIGSLFMTGSSSVDTNGYHLGVTGPTTLNLNGNLKVSANASNPALASFSTDTLDVNVGGVVDMMGGLLRVDSGGVAFPFDINRGTVRGWGTIDVHGDFANDGAIATGRPPGSDINTRYTLQINSPELYLLSIHTEPININLSTALDINGEVITAPTINMAANSILDVSQPWSHRSGSVNVNAFSTSVESVARIRGGTMIMNGDGIDSSSNVNVNSGTLVMEAELVVGHAGDVNVDTNASIQFDGPAEFQRTQWGAGRLNLNHDYTSVIVNNRVTINQETFDWDGTGTIADNTTIINANGVLSLNVEKINVVDNTFGGVLSMNSGDLSVHGTGFWTMAGQLNMNNLGGDIPVLSGDYVSISGKVNVDGAGPSRIEVPGIVQFENGSTGTLNRDLQLEASTLVNRGSTFSGNARLVNRPSAGLYLGDESLVGVEVYNQGLLVLVGGAHGGHSQLADYEQSSTGELRIRLGGTAAADFDRLVTTGVAKLGGKLSVSPIGDFTFGAGQSFDILDWGTLNGIFSSLMLPALADGLMWNTSQLYVNGTLSVTLAGDYNGNGVVDAADYVLWRKGLGTTYTAVDYDVWRANFGRAAGSGTSQTAANASDAIPEPATMILLLFAAAGLCRRQDRPVQKNPAEFLARD